MLGHVATAAKVATALGEVSPAFKSAKKYTHYGSFGIGSGIFGYMVGGAVESGSIKPLMRLSLLGTIGGTETIFKAKRVMWRIW